MSISSVSDSIGCRVMVEFGLRFKKSRLVKDLLSQRKFNIIFIKYNQALIKGLKNFIFMVAQIFVSTQDMSLSKQG